MTVNPTGVFRSASVSVGFQERCPAAWSGLARHNPFKGIVSRTLNSTKGVS
jgi:hypothetical protein